MKVSIPHVSDCTIAASSDGVTGSVMLPSCEAERYLNKVIDITIGFGISYKVITTAIGSFGESTATAVLNFKSVVDLMLDMPFYDDNEDYSGAIYFKPNYSTGEYEHVSLQEALACVLKQAARNFTTYYGIPVSYVFDMPGAVKEVYKVSWDNDTVRSVLNSLCNDVNDLIFVRNGARLIVKTINLQEYKYLPERYIEQRSLGLNLENSSTDVIIDAPGVDSYLDNIDLLKINMLHKVGYRFTNSYGSNSIPGLTADRLNFNADSGYIEYKTGSGGSDLELRINRDNRYKTHIGPLGDAATRYNWKKQTVIVDNDLGYVGLNNEAYLDKKYDRRANQFKINHYYANAISNLEYQGSLMICPGFRVAVGDVLRLKDNKTVIIKSIEYGMLRTSVRAQIGSIDGGAYNTIKSRANLADVVRINKPSNRDNRAEMILISGPGGQLKWWTLSSWLSSLKGLGGSPLDHGYRPVFPGSVGRMTSATKKRQKKKRKKAKEDAQQTANADVDEIMDGLD